MNFNPVALGGLISGGASALSSVGKLFGRKKRKREVGFDRQFIQDRMFKPYHQMRSIGGFGTSSDYLKDHNRTESFEFAPALAQYQDRQSQALAGLPQFGNLQTAQQRLDSGDNVFYNMAAQARDSERDRLLGMTSNDMFSRGLGNSAVFGNALGRLARSNAENAYADQARAINDEAAFNANAQSNIFGGLNNLYQYAQGLRGDTVGMRGQLVAAAQGMPSVSSIPQAPNVFDSLGRLGGMAGASLIMGGLNRPRQQQAPPVPQAPTAPNVSRGGGIGGLFSGLRGLPQFLMNKNTLNPFNSIA